MRKFTGVRDLAAFLADSEETHDAFVEQLFHYLVKQPIRAYGPARSSSDLRRSFVSDNRYNVRKLMVEIVAESAWIPDEEKPKPPVPREPGRRVDRINTGLTYGRPDVFRRSDVTVQQARDASSSATWGSARRPCRSS